MIGQFTKRARKVIPMFERFTVRARKVILRAQEEAGRLNSASVGPEHILLGIVMDPDGIGGAVLGTFGVTAAPIREMVESIPGRGNRPVGKRGIQFSEDGKRALEVAFQEARRLKHLYIGTEHLLLGLFRLDSGPIVNMLGRFQLTHEHVQDRIIKALASGGSLRDFPTEAWTRSNVVMCRVNDRDLEAIDALVEAGLRATRSDAAASLIRAGIESNKALFDKLHATVVQIRHLREQAKEITRQLAPEEAAPTDTPPSETRQPPGGESPTGKARPAT